MLCQRSPTVPTAWGRGGAGGRAGDGHRHCRRRHCHGAPGSTTLPLAGTLPKPKRLRFKPSGIGSPSMAPLHSARKSSVRSWEKTNVLFGLEGTSPSSPKTLLRMRSVVASLFSKDFPPVCKERAYWIFQSVPLHGMKCNHYIQNTFLSKYTSTFYITLPKQDTV